MIAPPFTRTVCACAACTACCTQQPGMLGPGDAEAIADHLGVPMADLEPALRASKGALIGNQRTGEVYNVPTITPTTDATGRCVFLDSHDRCTIHPVAPMGCRYFDMHMAKPEADRRSLMIHLAIAMNGAYATLRARLAARTVVE